MDQKYIQDLEAHLIAVIEEELALNGSYKNNAEFAKAAFQDLVANHQAKWSRIRRGKNNISFSDLVRIGILLKIEPSLLITQAYANMRRGKEIPKTHIEE
jgi:hypothetical protein